MSRAIVPKMDMIVNLGAYARNSEKMNMPNARKTPKQTEERVSRKAPSKMLAWKSASGFARPATLERGL